MHDRMRLWTRGPVSDVINSHTVEHNDREKHRKNNQEYKADFRKLCSKLHSNTLIMTSSQWCNNYLDFRYSVTTTSTSVTV